MGGSLAPQMAVSAEACCFSCTQATYAASLVCAQVIRLEVDVPRGRAGSAAADQPASPSGAASDAGKAPSTAAAATAGVSSASTSPFEGLGAFTAGVSMIGALVYSLPLCVYFLSIAGRCVETVPVESVRCYTECGWENNLTGKSETQGTALSSRSHSQLSKPISLPSSLSTHKSPNSSLIPASPRAPFPTLQAAPPAT